jgi:glycosyltransferase involved in cell wall biosynthesis
VTSTKADVALILEGTYPYVAGGVSTWVHQILGAYPDRKFALLHIGPYPGAYEKPRYTIPSNVIEVKEVYCRGSEHGRKRNTSRYEPPPPRRTPSRVLSAIRRLHLDDTVDDALMSDLAAGDLSIGELLHGEATFELLRNELYERVSPRGPFMDFFWHFRAMHIPLLRLLAAPLPDAAVLHAVSTGYAGLIGAIHSFKSGRPLVVTEHGLYAREREMELSRATWIKDLDERHGFGMSRPSPLRRFWSHYFRMLSRIAYHQATRLVTLSEANRAKQLADGAAPEKIVVVPNGVHWAPPPSFEQPAGDIPRDLELEVDLEISSPDEPQLAVAESATPARPFLRVGFVGRVVPIKDVITLIRAVGLAREQVDLEVWIIGPQDEDPTYAARCRALVESLELTETIKFLGPQPVAQMYPQLDVVLLTSLSEGQPLVMLEAYSAGVPCIATDVGACRELIEGGDELDRKLGPSGIVTRVANPAMTAAALCLLARDPARRRAMGQAAKARVAARYQLQQVVASYETLYASMVA